MPSECPPSRVLLARTRATVQAGQRAPRTNPRRTNPREYLVNAWPRNSPLRNHLAQLSNELQCFPTTPADQAIAGLTTLLPGNSTWA
jgi:hypothetical protein